jgi:hypothetical protein
MNGNVDMDALRARARMLRISVLEQQLELQQLEKEIERRLFLRLSNAGLSLAGPPSHVIQYQSLTRAYNDDDDDDDNDDDDYGRTS